MNANSNEQGNLERQGDLINEIGRILPTEKGEYGVPDDWQQLVYETRCVSQYSEADVKVTRADGSSQFAFAPDRVRDLIVELRPLMYTPEAGTWLSAQWVLQRTEGDAYSAKVSFNYDTEPQWDTENFRPSLYAADLRDFPRSAENTPQWLADKVKQAE